MIDTPAPSAQALEAVEQWRMRCITRSLRRESPFDLGSDCHGSLAEAFDAFAAAAVAQERELTQAQQAAYVEMMARYMAQQHRTKAAPDNATEQEQSVGAISFCHDGLKALP